MTELYLHDGERLEFALKSLQLVERSGLRDL